MRVIALLIALPLVAVADAPAGLDLLFEQADADHWATRWQAVERMARLPQDQSVFKLRAALLRDERPRVREAVAWACLLDPGLGNATVLGIALKKDAKPAVRRAAARALVHFRDRRSVEALVDALATEHDRRTELTIVETLRALTPAPLLLEPAGWKSWWEKNRHDPRFRPADQPPQTGEYEGVVLETRSVAALPDRKPSRPPSHVFVLPQFGWSNDIYGPYLQPLRRHAHLTWVRLPTIEALTGQSGFGDSIPVYPVARLVLALDKFRSAHDIDRFVILATGASGWIAMTYAYRFPKRCAGLLLIDTHIDKQSYADALRRGAARGTKDERWTAKTLMRENNTPFSESTLLRMHRVGLSRGFRDGADLEMGWLFRTAREPQGFATVPDLKWGKRARLEMPSLFVFSPSSAFSGHYDAERISKHFPKSMVAPIRQSAGMPWVEHNQKLHEILAHFLRRYELID